jgi:hypothetical protein
MGGFRREVDQIYYLLGYYVAYAGNSLATFRENLSVPSILEDGTDGLSRNVGKELPLYGA